MRAKRTLRAPAAAQIAVGALVLGLPTAAVAAVTTTSTGPSTAASVTTTQQAAAPSTELAAAVVRHPQRRRATRVRVPAHVFSAVAGDGLRLRGRLLPGSGGRIVHLVTRQDHRWHQLAWARTGRRGGFDLHFSAPEAGTTPLRVVFSGNKRLRHSSAAAGEVTAMRYTVASWYDDGGNTACGFHAYYGVANKTLPCGTHVRMSYGGRTVTATVDDRGPFVPGRDYDLNQNTARALGMYGVATVMSSI